MTKEEVEQEIQDLWHEQEVIDNMHQVMHRDVLRRIEQVQSECEHDWYESYGPFGDRWRQCNICMKEEYL